MTEQEIKVLIGLHEKGILTDEALALALNTAAEKVDIKNIDDDIKENYNENQWDIVQDSRNKANAAKERQAQRDQERLEQEAKRRRQEELDRISEEKENDITEKIGYLSQLRNNNGELIYAGLEEERNAITDPKEYYEFINDINNAYEQYTKQEERKEVKSIETLANKGIIDDEPEVEIEPEVVHSDDEAEEEPLKGLEEQNQEEMDEITNAMKELNGEQQNEVVQTPENDLDDEDLQIAKDADAKNTEFIEPEDMTKAQNVDFAVDKKEPEVVDLGEQKPDKGRQSVQRISTAPLALINKINTKSAVVKGLAAVGAITLGTAIIGIVPTLAIGGVALAGSWVANQFSKGAAAAGGKSR